MTHSARRAIVGPMEYPKIQTVFERDPEDMKRVVEDHLRWAEFGIPRNWLLTEKIDGTNIRLVLEETLHGMGLRIGGKTDNAQIPAFLFDHLLEKYPAALVADAFDPDTKAVIYGEGHGRRIQKNGGLYSETPAFVVFDVAVLAKDRVWWLDWSDVCDVAAKIGAQHVPVVAERATIEDAIAFVRSGLESRHAAQPRWAEGVVARTVPGLLTRAGKRLVWKLKARDFGGPEGPREAPDAVQF